MYQVVIERQAQKQLAKISPPYYQSIVAALQNLATNPRPQGYKKLKGRPGFRIRVADYRIIYQINDQVLTIFIIVIGHRKDIYE
jgi:mRNA interferase RelE/StbE